MLRNILRTIYSTITNLFNFNSQKQKYLFGIGLCFSLIALSTLAVLAAEPIGNSMPHQDFSEQEYIANYVAINEIDSETIPESVFLNNYTYHSLFLMVPLYSKLNSSDIMANNARVNILNLITTTPGITLGAITRELNLRNGTASHHIRILEREGYIKSKKAGKFRRYYCLGVKASGYNNVQDNIVSVINEQPGITQSEIAKELNLSRQVVNYNLKFLISSEIIQIEQMGNKSNCFLT